MSTGFNRGGPRIGEIRPITQNTGARARRLAKLSARERASVLATENEAKREWRAANIDKAREQNRQARIRAQSRAKIQNLEQSLLLTQAQLELAGLPLVVTTGYQSTAK